MMCAPIELNNFFGSMVIIINCLVINCVVPENLYILSQEEFEIPRVGGWEGRLGIGNSWGCMKLIGISRVVEGC